MYWNTLAPQDSCTVALYVGGLRKKSLYGNNNNNVGGCDNNYFN